MAEFANLADQIIQNSLRRRQEEAQKLQRTRPKKPPTLGVGQVIGRGLQAAAPAVGKAVTAIVAERDDRAADAEHVELLKEAFPPQYFEGKDKKTYLIQQRAYEVGQDIEKLLETLGQMRQAEKTMGAKMEFGTRSELRRKRREIQRALKAKRAELDEVSPGKAALKEIINRRRDMLALQMRGRGGEGKGEDIEEKGTKEFKLQVENLRDNVGRQLQGVPVGDHVQLIVDTGINLKRTPENVKKGFAILRDTMLKLGKTTWEDVVDRVKKGFVNSINEINSMDISEEEKNLKKLALMQQAKTFINPERVQELILENFARFAVAESNLTPDMLVNGMEGIRQYKNQMIEAAKSRTSEEFIESLKDESLDLGKQLMTFAFASMGGLPDIEDMEFGDDEISINTKDARALKTSTAFRISDFNEFDKNTIAWISKYMSGSLPHNSGEMVAALKAAQGAHYEAIKNDAIARGLIDRDMDEAQTKAALARLYGTAKAWRVFKGKYGIVETAPAPTEEETVERVTKPRRKKKTTAGGIGAKIGEITGISAGLERLGSEKKIEENLAKLSTKRKREILRTYLEALDKTRADVLRRSLARDEKIDNVIISAMKMLGRL